MWALRPFLRLAVAPSGSFRACSTITAHPSEVEPKAFKPKIPSRAEIFRKYPAPPMSICRQAFVEDLLLESSRDEEDRSKLTSLVTLHPTIWSAKPRIDIIRTNLDWQLEYKKISYLKQRSRYEMPPGPPGRPWPQKGTGRARHATYRSPLFVFGGKTHPPVGHRAKFWLPSLSTRINGLIHTLSIKFAQDDVRVMKDLEIPTHEADYLDNLVDERGWGISVLFVSAADLFPPNLTTAASSIDHMNLMPVYGLNVHSMLKHKTLVLSEEALNLLEYKLLYAIHRPDFNFIASHNLISNRPRLE